MAETAAIGRGDGGVLARLGALRLLPWQRLGTVQGAVLVMLAAMVLVLDSVLIPFHAADDDDHFSAAYAAAHFHFGPVRSPDPAVSSGGYVDAALPGVIERNYHAVRLGTKPVLEPTRWQGREVFHPTPLTTYLPLVYLPQIVAIRAGEAAGASVETTIHLARAANGLAALALVGLALVLLPEGLGVLVLLLFSLPKWLQLFASNSADPIDNALVAVLLGFACAALQKGEGRTFSSRHWALAALGLLALGGARPPLLALALPLVLAAWRGRSRFGIAAVVGACVVALGWWAHAMPAMHDARTPVTGTFGEKLSQFVFHAPQMLVETLSARGIYYAATFVGEMGYGDGRTGHFYPLPLWVYPLAAVMLGLCVAGLGAGERRLRLDPLASGALVVAALAMVGGIFFSMALGCTNLGEMVIEGVQGRYLLAPLVLLAAAAAGAMPPLPAAAARARALLPLFLTCNFALMAGLGIELYWRW